MTFGTLLREAAEPIPDVARMTLDPLRERLEQARLIVIGGATYGSSECNRLRARLTRELIRHSGVTTVALASSAPEAWWFDRFVRAPQGNALWPPPVGGFPHWVWRNGETFGFLRWLGEHNREVRPEHAVEICGLDLFDFYDAAASILECLEIEAPAAARQVRARLACITPWLGDPAANSDMTYPEEVQRAEKKVLALLRRRLDRRLKIVMRERGRHLECGPEIRSVDAREFLTRLYQGSATAWFDREHQMFETLAAHLGKKGIDHKVVVWAHNADVGDASAATLGGRGHASLGQLCRAHLGDDVRLVGFGVASGSLTAAGTWGASPEPTPLLPAQSESYEDICRAAQYPGFVLSLREAACPDVREYLGAPRPQRVIGPVYQPHTERASHYCQVSLPDQFDEYIWFNQSHPLMPVPGHFAR